MATLNNNNDLPDVNAPDIRPPPRRPTYESGAPGAVRARFQTVALAIGKSATGTYEHQPIDINREIRILRIQHGTTGDLECMLFPSALQLSNGQTSSTTAKSYPYTALSYAWGDPDEIASNKITIYKDTGARGVTQTLTGFNQSGTFLIHDNLKAALLSFRHPTKDVSVWVDALCINQRNKIEKNAQVARMHEVYTQAEKVCVWLGEGNGSTERSTFDFLQLMLDLQQLDELVADPEGAAGGWAMVVKLMKNRWFSRRWVIQELALSRDAFVRWGREDLVWKDFADSIALFMTRYEEIKRTSVNPDIYKATDARALGANVIVHATVNLFRKSNEGQIEQRLLPLEILVSSLLLPFEATEPRDTIFAVLMLANDSQPSFANPSATPDPRIIPDYGKCLVDVYADFMDYCIEKSQSLDILCRYWAAVQTISKLEALKKGKTSTEKMPTWIPLIENSAFGEPRYLPEGRANGDSFVGGLERMGQQVYHASAGLRAWHEFGTRNLNQRRTRIAKRFTFPQNKPTRSPSAAGDSRPVAQPACNSAPEIPTQASSRAPKYTGMLRLRGFCLDTISQVSGRVAGSGIIPNDALEMGGWIQRETQTVPDRLWRTLVADRGPNGKSAPPWYSRTCWECLQRTDRLGDLDIPDLKTNRGLASAHITFLERVQPVVFKRRFFQTEGSSASSTTSSKSKNEGVVPGPSHKLRSQKSLFGLGSPFVKKGDLVCIIFGCSVPVVLRKDKEGKCYQFIGECYVHGMMDGEAITGKPPVWPYDQLAYTTFELR